MRTLDLYNNNSMYNPDNWDNCDNMDNCDNSLSASFWASFASIDKYICITLTKLGPGTPSRTTQSRTRIK
jgi:hypothetical protein